MDRAGTTRIGGRADGRLSTDVARFRGRAPGAILVALLGLTMFLASLSQGSAQVQRLAMLDAVIEIVLCADGTEQTVLLDRNGDPVDPSHCTAEMCSACLGPLLTVLPRQPDAAAPLPEPGSASFAVFAQSVAVLRPASDPRPRGPPATT